MTSLGGKQNKQHRVHLLVRQDSLMSKAICRMLPIICCLALSSAWNLWTSEAKMAAWQESVADTGTLLPTEVGHSFEALVKSFNLLLSYQQINTKKDSAWLFISDRLPSGSTTAGFPNEIVPTTAFFKAVHLEGTSLDQCCNSDDR